MPAIDITGERFGKLIVLERDTSKHGGAAYWICKCDCGNVKSIRGSALRQTKQPTRSCGKCITFPDKIDTTSEIGKIYGRLTVIERDMSKPIGHGHSSYWLCQCSCGNTVSVALSQLHNNKTQSCGCFRKEITQQLALQDISNQRYGKLIALENTWIHSNDGSYLWKCKCDCGNIKEYSLSTLNANRAFSCGCLKMSLGESKIIEILEKNNIFFQHQYSFSDLRGKNNTLLKYDFAILNDHGLPIRLIEFDGEQHYDVSSQFYSLRRVELDNIKNNYAKEHNYPLVRIPYSELRHLSLEMLLGDKYLVSNL